MMIHDGMELTEKEVDSMNGNKNVRMLCNKPVHTYISSNREWVVTFYWEQEKATVERMED